MLTACGFILVFGRIYTFAPTKWVFLTGIALFEIGSAICGAAPNSISLIIGRAIAGFGSSGIFTGAISILLNSVPLHRRPFYQGLFGACFGVASVAGPLLGGVFTQGHLGWRWCFYINLPFGGFTIAALIVFLNLDEDKRKLTFIEQLKQLDPIGTGVFLPSIVCLLLALQWGGVTYSWSSWRVVLCLCVFAVLFIIFIAVQYINRNRNALMPARIAFQRSVLFGSFYQFMLGSTMLCTIVYIPLWFQAIKGVSPVKSGIDTIPLVGGVVVGSITSGAIVGRIGYYLPFMYLASILMTIGSGLLTTLNVSSPSSHWIGYQVLTGLGIGFGMQQSNLAVQTCLPNRDVPIGTSIIFFYQTFGGALFLSVSQNTFIDKFLTALKHVPGVNPDIIIQTGATALRDHVPKSALPAVIEAYSHSVTHGPFLVSTILASLSIIGALGTELRSVKEKQAHAPKAKPKDIESGSINDDDIDGAAEPSISEEKPVDVDPISRPAENVVKAEQKSAVDGGEKKEMS
jgi:MFS family permease